MSVVKETQGADFAAMQAESQQLQEQVAMEQQNQALAQEDVQAKEQAYTSVFSSADAVKQHLLES